MADNNEMLIIFGAETAPLRKEVQSATRIVDQFGNEVSSTADKASKGFDRVRRSFNGIPKATDVLSKSTAGLKSSSNSAALALNDLSRVAQDVPFGFIGIQNNINPLLESFRRVKAETGSTSGALKALAGSLVGAGGLGLAIGILSSAFLIYQNGIMGFNRKTKEAKDSFDEFKKSLKDSATISSDATASVQDEILKVGVLAKVITDVNRSTAERKRALEELHQTNKNIFGDYTLEAKSLSTLATATNEYTQALIQQAIAKGFADEISKVSSELFKQEKILQKVAKGFTDAQNAANRKTNARAASLGESRKEFVERKTKEETNALNDQVGVVGELRNKLFDLTTGYAAAIEKGLLFKDLDTSGGNGKKEVDAIKQRVSALKELIAAGIDVQKNTLELRGLEIKLILRDGKKEGFTADEIEQLVYDKMFPQSDIKLSRPLLVTVPVQATVKELIDKGDPAGDNLTLGIQRTFDRIVKAGKEAGARAQAELAKPFELLRSSIQGTVADTFQGLGEGIGQILAGASPIQVFVQIIADALQQLGKALIAFGIAKKLAIDSLKSLNPFVAIGAGIAAIAAGALLKSQLNKQHKLADGGLVMGPTQALIGEAGPEMVIPLNRANQFLNNNSQGSFPDKFRVEGTDLVLVLNRAMASRK
jgi:hypothetical protein